MSFAYYLRVIAVMWMGGYEVELPPCRRARQAASGWSPEADLRAQPEVAAIAILFAAATILFGVAGPAVRRGTRRGHGDLGPALAPARPGTRYIRAYGPTLGPPFIAAVGRVTLPGTNGGGAT